MNITGNLCRRRFQQGLSLIELLVALAMGLAVLVGLSSVYVVVKQSFRFGETSGRMQEDGTFALDSIARDLRMAGYAGCPGITKTELAGPPAETSYFPGSVMASSSPGGITGSNPLAQIFTDDPEVTRQPFTPSNFIRGFDNVPHGMFAPDAVPATSNTDSLFFAGGSSKAVSVSAAMATATSSLTLAADTYGWANNVYDMIVSSCASSSIFKGNVTVDGGAVSIDHGTAMGNGQATFKSDALFGADAIVTPVEWRFYYVATQAAASTPSLMRVFFNGNTRSAPEEIISNVESLQLQYGENTTVTAGAPTLVADVWRTCAAGPATASCDPVVDWSRVVAVRIGLMLVSSEDNANPGVTLLNPTLLGQAYTRPVGASSNRLRKEFSTTVVLRNRVAPR